MKCQVILLVLFASIIISPVFAQETSYVFINKSVSQTSIEWSDEIGIKITVFGVGDKQISDIRVTDAVPFGFKLVSNNGVKTENEFVVFQLDSMQPGGQNEFSYKIKPIDGMRGEKSIDTNLPRASVSYTIDGVSYNKESNSIQVTLEQSKRWWEENIGAAVALLVVLSFGFGMFGTIIHNQNNNFGKKEQGQQNNQGQQEQGQQVNQGQQAFAAQPVHQAQQGNHGQQADNGQQENHGQSEESKNEKTTYPPLIGGVAGIIVLASFEGLSSLFANGQLQPTVQNMIVLIATSLAAGFTPVAVIDKMTSKFRDEANTANAQKASAEAQKAIAQKETEQKEKEKKELEERFQAIEQQLSIAKGTNDQLKIENEKTGDKSMDDLKKAAGIP